MGAAGCALAGLRRLIQVGQQLTTASCSSMASFGRSAPAPMGAICLNGTGSEKQRETLLARWAKADVWERFFEASKAVARKGEKAGNISICPSMITLGSPIPKSCRTQHGAPD